MRPLWGLALALVLVAGCLQTDATADSADANEAPSAPLTRAEDAGLMAQTNTTTGVPYSPAFLAVTPDVPVAGYRVQIPTDAAAPWFEGSSFHYVHFLVAPTFEEAPEGLTILVFDLETKQLVAGVVHAPVDLTTWLTAALKSEERVEPTFEPLYLRLPESYAGREVGVVVAGQGLRGPVGVVVHGDPDFRSNQDTPTAQAFTGANLTAPVPIGTGVNFHYSALLNLHLGIANGAPGVIGYELKAGTVSVDDRLGVPDVRPHASVRDVTFTTSTPHEAGWSLSTVIHLSTDGVSEWAYDVRAGPAQVSDEGHQVGATAYGVIGSWLLWGAPVAQASGDGEGAQSAELDVFIASTNNIHIELLETIGFDATLEVLLGVTAPPMTTNFEGLLMSHEHGLALRTGDRTMHLPHVVLEG